MSIKTLAGDDKSGLVKKVDVDEPIQIQQPSVAQDLVEEGHVNQAVVENQRFLGPQQLGEQSPDVDASIIRTSLIKVNSRRKCWGEEC